MLECGHEVFGFSGLFLSFYFILGWSIVFPLISSRLVMRGLVLDPSLSIPSFGLPVASPAYVHIPLLNRLVSITPFLLVLCTISPPSYPTSTHPSYIFVC